MLVRMTYSKILEGVEELVFRYSIVFVVIDSGKYIFQASGYIRFGTKLLF
jgi:hypothetical protein